MDKISTSLSSVIDSLTPALQKLSETFCVSVDYLRENAMHYILEYGQYCLAKDIIWWTGLWFTIGFILCIGLWILELCMNADGELDADGRKAFSQVIFGIAIITIIAMITATISVSIPYLMSPEMYSIEQVMKLIPQ
jgi:hypothetical protein